MDQFFIAGSISTMSARADNSYEPRAEKARDNHREQAEVLAESGADVIVLEMMRDLQQTSYAMEAAVATGLPVWVSFSCKTTHLLGGDVVGIVFGSHPPDVGGGHPGIPLETQSGHQLVGSTGDDGLARRVARRVVEVGALSKSSPFSERCCELSRQDQIGGCRRLETASL
jgi:homocysteine S-methyltransferase